MNIINILEGIERLVSELLLWIIFIPKTLFRIVAHPDWVTDYIEEELAKESERFDNYISPILLFLTSSVVLFIISDQVANTANIPQAENILTELKGIRGIVAGLGFLSLPLLFSLTTESLRRTRLTREGIQRILYIQCFYFSPLTLSIFALYLFTSLLPEDEPVIILSAFLITILMIIWFLIVEVKLIARELKSGIGKAMGVLFGSIAVIVVGGFFFLSSLETGEIDGHYEGGTEEYLGLSLPGSGEFSIYVGGFEGSVGNFRLILAEGSEIGGREGLIQVGEGEPIRGTGSLAYGQVVDGRVTRDVASTWTFDGDEGDVISIRVVPDEGFDVLFDVRYANGTSIFDGDEPNYTIGIGYVYVLLIGAAVVLGFRSLIRKPQKAQQQGEGPQNT